MCCRPTTGTQARAKRPKRRPEPPVRWTPRPVPASTVAQLARATGLSRPAAAVLHGVGVADADAAQAFITPLLRTLDDPFRLTHMDAAVARLQQAAARSEPILVFGDYDVDGVTSTVFLLSVLQRLGIFPRHAVPRRLEEGYGLSMAALSRVLAEGAPPSLVICLDCGTNSVDEVAWLKARGTDVIILDHHQSRERLPEGAIIVNPHLFDPVDAPWRDLCTVGLVFKFVHALLKQLRAASDDMARQIDIREFLDLVALGTVADLVPLTGENRLLAKKGLEMMRDTRRAGLTALFEVSGMSLGSPVTPFDISFRLSPRINASGRLADAAAPIELLLSDDWARCREIALELDAHNKDRQDIERAIAEEAEALVEAHFADAPALVLASPGWHPGVVGIVASRISVKYHRPTLVLGKEGTLLKGSGRSVPGVSLVEALTPCASLLANWGGHPMAVGVSMEEANIAAVRAAFCSAVLQCTANGVSEPALDIATWVDPEELTDTLFDELESIGPYGMGNPEPVFGVRGVKLGSRPATFGNGHCRFPLDAGNRRLQCLGWRQAETPPPTRKPVDLAVRLNWNVWNGKRTPQCTLVAWRAEAGDK